MDRITRRSMIAGGSAGALGLAGAAAVGVHPAGASESPLSADEVAALPGPAIVQVVDPTAGTVAVFVGETETTFTDKSLVARIMRASK